MKKLLSFSAFAFVLMLPLMALAQLPAPDAGVYQVPTSTGQLIGNLPAFLTLIKAHYWVGVSLVAVQIVIYLIGLSEQYNPFMKSHGTVITTSLAAVAAFLGLLVAGQNGQMALITFFVTLGPMYLKDIMQEIGLVKPDQPLPALAPAPVPAPAPAAEK